MNLAVLNKFKATLAFSVSDQNFIKLSLGNYKGAEADLKSIYIKLVEIKGAKMLAFNYRYKTKDIFKNYSIADGLALVFDNLKNGFRVATLFTIDQEVILESNLKGEFRYRSAATTTVRREISLAHDKQKKRMILAKDNVYLHELGLTALDGTVFKNGQDKYKQINQYIEILSSLIKEFPVGTIKNVVDMGAGKGYLTFALYDYLLNHQQAANVVGVEFRKDLVELCNAIALKSNFEKLTFVEGTIKSYEDKNVNLLIALHACDTATDDAIFKGIQADAELIVVAPCCHKQIRREMEKGKAGHELNFVTKHGIFLERQAEMVTDGIRALVLEYFGYKTKVFEFVSGVHTPKNVLVVGVKKVKSQKLKDKNLQAGIETVAQQEILQKIKSAKAFFGINNHYLEKLLQL